MNARHLARGLALVTLLGAICWALFVAGPGCRRRASKGELRAWDVELRRLQAEQDSLRARAAELVARDPRLQKLPKGDVVVGVPTSFLRTVIERVFDDVAGNVTLSLGGLKAHVTKKVKKVVTIGEFTLDVDIEEVVGKLKPGRPNIRFGGNRISMSLPVAVSEGHGRAKLHFVWDGKNVADMTCGDVDVTRTVTGNVVPSDYVVSGSLNLTIRENRVVCTPVFPETRLRIRVEPSQASWDSVKAILEAKDGMCGWVLDKVDVPSILEGVVQEKGFNVKLPVNKLKPFALPAGVRDTVRVGERVLTFDTRTNTLRIDPDAIWYSADVTLK
jgi:hypothetical protein